MEGQNHKLNCQGIIESRHPTHIRLVLNLRGMENSIKNINYIITIKMVFILRKEVHSYGF